MPESDKGSNERRGLTSADEETLKRVASEGGKVSHKDDDKKSSSSSGDGRGGSSGGGARGRTADSPRPMRRRANGLHAPAGRHRTVDAAAAPPAAVPRRAQRDGTEALSPSPPLLLLHLPLPPPILFSWTTESARSSAAGTGCSCSASAKSAARAERLCSCRTAEPSASALPAITRRSVAVDRQKSLPGFRPRAGRCIPDPFL